MFARERGRQWLGARSHRQSSTYTPQLLLFLVALTSALIPRSDAQPYPTMRMGNTDAQGQTPEDILQQDLLKNYNRGARPPSSGPIHVQIGVAMSEILDLNLVDGHLKTLVWLRCGWYDARLDWASADYNNVTQTFLLPSQVWHPDFLVYNHVEKFVREDDTKIALYSDGRGAYWSRTAVLETTCMPQVSKFPFDQQRCTFVMGPWNLHSALQNLTIGATHTYNQATGEVRYLSDGSIDLSVLEQNTDFIISTEPALREERVYNPQVGEHWTVITFYVNLERRYWFYVQNLILPIAMTVFTTFFTFIMPPDCGERIGLGVTCMLVVVAMMTAANQYVPASDVMTTFGMFQIGEFVFTFTSLFITSVVMVFHHQQHDGDLDGSAGTEFVYEYLWLTPQQAFDLSRKIDFVCVILLPSLHCIWLAVVLTPTQHFLARAGWGLLAGLLCIVLVWLLSLVIFILRNWKHRGGPDEKGQGKLTRTESSADWLRYWSSAMFPFLKAASTKKAAVLWRKKARGRGLAGENKVHPGTNGLLLDPTKAPKALSFRLPEEEEEEHPAAPPSPSGSGDDEHSMDMPASDHEEDPPSPCHPSSTSPRGEGGGAAAASPGAGGPGERSPSPTASSRPPPSPSSRPPPSPSSPSSKPKPKLEGSFFPFNYLPKKRADFTKAHIKVDSLLAIAQGRRDPALKRMRIERPAVELTKSSTSREDQRPYHLEPLSDSSLRRRAKSEVPGDRPGVSPGKKTLQPSLSKAHLGPEASMLAAEKKLARTSEDKSPKHDADHSQRGDRDLDP